MAKLKGFPSANTISTDGLPEKEIQVDVKVTMPKGKIEEFSVPDHDPDVGEFYIGDDGELYLNQED